MSEKKSQRHFIRRFPQHIVPDELSLLSLYEILIYGAILGLCVFLYIGWSRIPIIEKNIYIEELGTISQKNKNESIADIRFYIPNSTVFADSSAHYLYTLSTRDTISSIGYSEALDSLKDAFFSHRPSARDWYAGNLFYFGFDAPARFRKLDNHVVVDTLLGGCHRFSGYHLIKKNPPRVVSEQFINGDSVYFVSDLYDGELTKPSFWSLRDISQAYYSIKIHSHSIDSIKVQFTFRGVVDVSSMGEITPSQVSGNLINFSFRPDYQKPQQDTAIIWVNQASYERFIPRQEYTSTIQFHIKSLDMENAQSRRVFLVTTILSALVTIFLAFFIILFYRIFKHDEE
ncbi:MAG: hypothetical protein IKX45_00320 [Bacteroidales bacterium]|nr:hypothetical protein [Bacteroidales bacterium]